MKLSEVNIYGRPISDFLLPDQIEIAQKQLDESPAPDGWVRVESAPLFTINDKGWWECTEAGDKPFIAAVPYHDKSDNKDKWWIRHCVIEDEIGLCVVGDDDNEPAGWDMKDITHYQPLPQPPKQ